jgi:hypothetical protein
VARASSTPGLRRPNERQPAEEPLGRRRAAGLEQFAVNQRQPHPDVAADDHAAEAGRGDADDRERDDR